MDVAWEEELDLPPIFGLMPKIIDHLDARDILRVSQAARGCRKFRSSETFERHLMLNGWDTEALVRRSEMMGDFRSRPWMFLARSAVEKGDLLRHYALLPKEHEKGYLSKDKKYSFTVKKVLRILIDAVTEHGTLSRDFCYISAHFPLDQHNLSKLTSLAASLQLSFIQFVTAIPAYNWKARNRKTFVIAAYTNGIYMLF